MSRYWNEKAGEPFYGVVIRDIVLIGVVLIAAGMYGCPQYGVWEQGLKGEAELRRAAMNRQIAVNEAEAKLGSATLLAKAEIERAKGVAEANKIIGEGLKGHEEYLRYLWIMSLEHSAIKGGATVIYVPTEANLPVLEASRVREQPKIKQ